MAPEQRTHWLFIVNPLVAVLVKIRACVLISIVTVSMLFIVSGSLVLLMSSKHEPTVSLLLIGAGMGILGGWGCLALFSRRYREHVARPGEATSRILAVGLLLLAIFGMVGSMLCCGEVMLRVVGTSKSGDLELAFYQIVIPGILVFALVAFLLTWRRVGEH